MNLTEQLSQLASDVASSTAADWLTAQRQAALSRFQAVGIPTRTLETWKYTDLSALAKQNLSLASAAKTSVNGDWINANAVSNSVRAVFINGFFSAEHSTLDNLESGLQIDGLAAVLRDEPALLENQFGNNIEDAARNSMHELNLAAAQDGLVVRVAANSQIDTPIQLININTGGHYAPLRNIVIAERGASVTLAEQYISNAESAYFNHVVSQLIADDNAEIRHTIVQQEAATGWQVNSVLIEQQRDSRVHSQQYALTGRLLRSEAIAQLQATGTEVHMAGLYYGDSKQHVDIHTRVDHLKPHGISRENYRGILDGRAQGVFNGKVVVHPDAQKTDSIQSNKNLMLSKHAEVDTKPELEIYADDVKCAHGATVGQLDKNALFYLRSRGIDANTSRSLMTYAFAAEVIAEIQWPELRKHVEHSLLQLLASDVDLRDFDADAFNDVIAAAA